MTLPGPPILLTDSDTGQNRSALATVRALASTGYRPVVATCARHSLAASSRHCADRVAIPPVRSERFATEVRTELKRRPYLCVLPSSDAALFSLDQPGRHLADKEQLSSRAAAAGIPFPPQRRFASGPDLRAADRDLEYPVAIKPAVNGAATQLNVTRVDGPEDLEVLPLSEDPVLVQPWIDDAMSAVSGVMWRGSLVAVVHQRYLRRWPVQAGVASAAVTVEPDLQLEERIRALLDGFDGIFQVQFVGKHLIDLNPRVYGSLPLAVAAGANLPGIFCGLVAGRTVAPVRGRAGVRYRWVEGDLRHLLDGLRTGRSGAAEVLAALRPRSATAHSVTAVTDARPLLARLGYVMRGPRLRVSRSPWNFSGGFRG